MSHFYIMVILPFNCISSFVFSTIDILPNFLLCSKWNFLYNKKKAYGKVGLGDVLLHEDEKIQTQVT